MALGLLVSVGVGVGAGAGCRQEQISQTKHDVKDAWHNETVDELVRVNALGGKLVEQQHVIAGAPDAVLSLATLDVNGYATGASYRREGPKGKRYVEFKQRDDGKRIVFSRGDDETIAVPDALPVVDLEMLPHLKLPAVVSKPMNVVALDIENAAIAPALINGGGFHVLPLTAPVSANDPVLPMHTSKAPFIESQTPKVVHWCKQQASSSDAPMDAANKIALAVKPKLASDRAGGPPSALNTLAAGAYDEGGAALVVACLRALDRPARVVTGNVAGSSRTWAQVNDGKQWLDVDALDVDLDGKMHSGHVALVEGLPGPLTTGRLPTALRQTAAPPLPVDAP
jgi:hypothetical protein